MNNTFQDLNAGDRVRFMRTNGIGRNGVEWVEATGTVIKYLTFANHVVVATAGGRGTPYVVDATNFKAVVRRIA